MRARCNRTDDTISRNDICARSTRKHEANAAPAALLLSRGSGVGSSEEKERVRELATSNHVTDEGVEGNPSVCDVLGRDVALIHASRTRCTRFEIGR